MRRMLKLIGFMVLLLISAYTVVFGLLYATRMELMPHHDAVLPDEATPQVLPLYFTLMRLSGGATTALGLLCLYVLSGPVRAGSKSAATAVSLCLVSFFIATATTAAHLEAISGSATHWEVMAVLVTLTIAGFACLRFGAR